jgi:tetratricopeptide (TPR) repeat protein
MRLRKSPTLDTPSAINLQEKIFLFYRQVEKSQKENSAFSSQELEEIRALIWAMARMGVAHICHHIREIRWFAGPFTEFWEKTNYPYTMLPRDSVSGSKDLFIKALEAHEQKNSVNALKFAREGGTRNPSAKGLLSAGLIYHLCKEYSKAQKYYERALQADPKLSRAHYYMGHLHMQNSRWKEAYQSFSQHEEMPSPHFETYYYRGLICFILEQTNQGISDFQRYLTLQPQGYHWKKVQEYLIKYGKK